MTFRGALVTTIGTPSQSIPNATLQFLNFNTVERDTDSFFNPAVPTRLTVPTGVSKVRLAGQVVFNHQSMTGLRQVVIKKNFPAGLGWYAGVPASTIVANQTTTTDVHVSTPVIDVQEGDFFELEVYQSGGVPITALASVGTWFTIEVVE